MTHDHAVEVSFFTHSGRRRPIRDNVAPGQIVYESIQKAKRIIESGLTGRNDGDFESEFAAYWGNKYSERDKLSLSVASLINKEIDPSEPVKVLQLARRWGQFDTIIFTDDTSIEAVKNALKDDGIRFLESLAFYANELPLVRPPFELTNKAALALLKIKGAHVLDSFATYMDQVENPILIFRKTINQQSLYFGWKHEKYKVAKGFRRGKVSSFLALNRFHMYERVTRLIPQVVSKERMVRRTSYLPEGDSRSFCFVGLGSIGSNLCSLLRSLHPKELRFIDPELLAIENTGRHFLGFEYSGMNKALAMKRFIHRNHPTCLVKSIDDKSVVDVICESSRFINECDYTFISIGKTETEFWIDKSMYEGTIKKPIFYLWVEPYLAGGHCVFVHPQSKKYFRDLFKDQVYGYNVISQNSYESQKKDLSIREAGCQTSFTPYSLANVTLFLSALFPHITEVIRSKSDQSHCYTWIGDLGNLKSLGLEFDPNFQAMPFGSLLQRAI